MLMTVAIAASCAVDRDGRFGAGMDAGRSDAGPGVDAGAPPDVGPGVDAGSPPDAGPVPVPPDAGPPDAGPEDCFANPDCSSGGLYANCPSGGRPCAGSLECIESSDCGGSALGCCTVTCRDDEDCPGDGNCEHGICWPPCTPEEPGGMCPPGRRCDHDGRACEWG